MALIPWIRIGQPLEVVMDDYARTFDAWEAGGIRGVVFGRLLFSDGSGQFTVPALLGSVEPYRARGFEAKRRDVALDSRKEQLLHRMLEDVKGRGWELMIFSPASGNIEVAGIPAKEDPYRARQLAAVWDDIFAAFPEADGGILDGWTESAYELKYHHGHEVFREMTDVQKETAAVRGYDVDKLHHGRQHLHRRFQNFTSRQVRYYGDRGVLSAMNLFDINEDALYWLRWRREDGIKEGQAFRRELDTLPRKLLLGNGPRAATFSGMTGLDFHAWDKIVDVLLVKHYFWHRGFDGMYGTVARWVKQIGEWNSGLTEAECWTVLRAWMGVELPEVETLADLELGFPQAFFDEVVFEETRRALDAVSDPYKVMPWVDTGRNPHAGDPMTAGDLHRILTASANAGLQRFLFHNHGHLTAAEWVVISRMCGVEWNELPNGYWPPATEKPARFG